MKICANLRPKINKGHLAAMSNATGSPLQVPLAYWDQLNQADLSQLCRMALARPVSSDSLALAVLNTEILINVRQHSLQRFERGDWQNCADELLELVVLVYLLQAAYVPLTGELISISDLKDAHFFQGPHELRTDSLLERFGTDLEAFHAATRHLEGKMVDMADAACRLLPLPRIPVYYLLWQGDEQFTPRMTILFDRSIEQLFAADAIWGLVNMVNERLYKAGIP